MVLQTSGTGRAELLGCSAPFLASAALRGVAAPRSLRVHVLSHCGGALTRTAAALYVTQLLSQRVPRPGHSTDCHRSSCDQPVAPSITRRTRPIRWQIIIDAFRYLFIIGPLANGKSFPRLAPSPSIDTQWTPGRGPEPPTWPLQLDQRI